MPQGILFNNVHYDFIYNDQEAETIRCPQQKNRLRMCHTFTQCSINRLAKNHIMEWEGK